MKYSEYEAIAEKIQEFLTAGSITLETANALNDAAYNKFSVTMEKKKEDDDVDPDEEGEDEESKASEEEEEDEKKVSRKKSKKKGKKDKDDEECDSEECEEEEEDDVEESASVYSVVADCIEDAMNRGAITESTANIINDVAYEKYAGSADDSDFSFNESDAISLIQSGFTVEEVSSLFAEGAIQEDAVFIKSIFDASKRYKEAAKTIKSAIRKKDGAAAVKALEDGRASLLSLKKTVEATPSTIANTALITAGKAVISALLMGFSVDAINAQGGVQMPTDPKKNELAKGDETLLLDKGSAMKAAAGVTALKDVVTSAKKEVSGSYANQFKRAALKAVDAKLAQLDKFAKKANKLNNK